MTRNLKLYLLFSIAWSVAFFATLNWGLEDPRFRWPFIITASVMYGLGFYWVGYALGRPDDQSTVRYDLRRAYSAVSNVASAAIGTVWIVMYQREGLPGVPIYLAVLAVFWITGALQARGSIKGMSKEDIFQ